MDKEQRKTIIQIAAGVVLLIVAVIVPYDGIINFSFFLLAYIVSGYTVLINAVKNILHGQIFDENFLMSIASIGAFFIGEYPEAVVVMIFYLIGTFFEDYALDKSRKSISKLMDLRPDYAFVLRDGAKIRIAPEEIAVGDTIVVSPGERIPVDGIISKGVSTADTSALTGESLPVDLMPGAEVLSGSVNLSGVIEVTATKVFEESTASKILDLVENASSKKAVTENFITKFARFYTPCVVIMAVLIAVLPTLIFSAPFVERIKPALIFLVVSCPCALVISVPLGFFGGIGGASSKGILVKGSNYLEAAANAEIVVLDKTGTLTSGTFSVTDIHPHNVSEKELIEYAALAEGYSNHPISLSIKKAYGIDIDFSRIAQTEEIAGYGVCAVVDGVPVCAGTQRLMAERGYTYIHPEKPGTAVHVAVGDKYIGYILISDKIKPDAKAAIELLKDTKVKKIAMLTGDKKEVAEYTAHQLGIDEVYAEQLPADKIDNMERLHKSLSPKGKLLYVGDGINDAPVLAQADVGIAMGGLGSDAAIEAADAVIMDDKPSSISTLINIARKTRGIVKTNIIFALSVKAIVLILGALGLAGMWEAVFADVGVSVLAILNSMRLLRVKNKD